MKNGSNSLLISAMLWLSILLIDTLTACSYGGAMTETTPPDRTPPVISGTADQVIYQGGAPKYMEGVTVTDDQDEQPGLTLDITAVDPDTPGVYTAVYTAEDAAGNRSSTTITVTVLEMRTGYADMDTIYAALDAKLAEIIGPATSPREQVGRIYDWARSSLSYSGHSDKSDPYQAAYQMLTIGAGDCYNYYAVCKLMFDRLGIPNIDVVKVKNSMDDSQHFWSLVSVDGGTSYYHFDATPRIGEGDDFCLVTDEFLDEYSAAHNGSHNRNKGLYPATPEV